MRAIINGKRYDTETGKCICQCPEGYLYKKYHSIEFFLCDRQKNIRPVPFAQARDICYKHSTKELYDSLFVPSRIHGRTNTDLSMTAYSKFRICAQTHGRTMKEELEIIADKEWRNLDRHKR